MQTIRIALAGATEGDRERVSGLLRRAIPDLELTELSTGQALFMALREQTFDCIVLDSDLPDMNNLIVLRQIRLTPGQRHTPVVVLAKNDDSRTAVRAIKLGASDYLALKHASLGALRQAILAAISSSEQIRVQERQQKQLEEQALKDPLTGLLNRRAFSARLDKLTDPQGNQGRQFALLIIDLNQFKEVNDQFGHDAGDRVLVEIADRLRQVTRCEDSVFRIGGDEFVVVIENDPSADGAMRLARRLFEVMQPPVMHEEQVNYRGGGSIGVALYPRDGLSPQELVRGADEAMYQAKASGAGVRLFGNRNPD